MLWLLRWLPEGSAWSASLSGGPAYRTWTAPVLLAAAQVNALNAANWQRAGGKGKKPSFIEPPKPRPAPTPAGEKPKRGMRKPGAIAARAMRGAALRSGPAVAADT